MARASTVTRLSLDEWFRQFGVSPLHGNQVIAPNNDPGRSPICSQPWLQFGWQTADRVGREEVAIAIAEAEAQIEEMLGYHLLPTWEYDEWRPTARPYNPELIVLPSLGDVRGYGRVIALNWAYFISGGIEAATFLGASAITFTDVDSDGYKETATVTFGPTALVADASELEVHTPEPGSNYAEENRIRPINVKKVDNGNGTFTYTITFRREQVVKTALLNALPPVVAVDGGVDANFFSSVNLWRHYNDPSTQATLLWENAQTCGACNGTGCPSCVYAAQTACLLARQDPKLSMVAYSPVDWDATTSSFTSTCLAVARDPDVVRAFYRSGWQAKRSPISARFSDSYPNQVMDPHWARIVAHFAASKLDRPVCDCGPTAAQIDYWAADLAFQVGSEQLSSFSLSSKDLDNPFGTKRGAVMAWKAIQSPAVGRAVLV